MRGLHQFILRSTALALAGWMLGFILFANVASLPSSAPLARADAIVALTGGTRRIQAAGQLLQAGKAKRLLISGVNRAVSHAKLRNLLGIDAELFDCCVNVGYTAQNTRGNAMETRNWADEHQLESVIVVTSSYHMPRSLSELGYAMPSVDLIAYPVLPDQFRSSPWWLNRESILVLGAEYLKYLPSAAQFWLARLIDTPSQADRKHGNQKAVAVQ